MVWDASLSVSFCGRMSLMLLFAPFSAVARLAVSRTWHVTSAYTPLPGGLPRHCSLLSTRWDICTYPACFVSTARNSFSSATSGLVPCILCSLPSAASYRTFLADADLPQIPHLRGGPFLLGSQPSLRRWRKSHNTSNSPKPLRTQDLCSLNGWAILWCALRATCVLHAKS